MAHRPLTGCLFIEIAFCLENVSDVWNLNISLVREPSCQENRLHLKLTIAMPLRSMDLQYYHLQVPWEIKQELGTYQRIIWVWIGQQRTD